MPRPLAPFRSVENSRGLGTGVVHTTRPAGKDGGTVIGTGEGKRIGMQGTRVAGTETGARKIPETGIGTGGAMGAEGMTLPRPPVAAVMTDIHGMMNGGAAVSGTGQALAVGLGAASGTPRQSESGWESQRRGRVPSVNVLFV